MPLPAAFWSDLEYNVHLLELVLQELRTDRFPAVSKQLIKALNNPSLYALQFIPHLASFCLELETLVGNRPKTKSDLQRTTSLLQIQEAVKQGLSKLKSTTQLGPTTETDWRMYQACMRSVITSHKRTCHMLDVIKAKLSRPAVPQTTVAILRMERALDQIEAKPSTHALENMTPEPSDQQIIDQVLGMNSSKRLPALRPRCPQLCFLSGDNKPEVDVVVSESVGPDPSTSNLSLAGLNSPSTDILNDLWLVHNIHQPWQPFSLSTKTHQLMFYLERPSCLQSRSEQVSLDDDDQKPLPIELVLLLRSPTPSLTLSNLHDQVQILINDQKIQSKPPHLNSKIWAIPIPKSFLKKKNELMMQIPDNESFSQNIVGEWSLELVTMLSEAEIIEKAFKKVTSDEEVYQLFQVALEHQKVKLSLEDPVVHKLIEHPVRGAVCEHLECFDLKTFVESNKGSCQWRCPIDDCQKKLSPLDLNSDQWVADNIENWKKLNLDGNWEMAVELNF